MWHVPCTGYYPRVLILAMFAVPEAREWMDPKWFNLVTVSLCVLLLIVYERYFYLFMRVRKESVVKSRYVPMRMCPGLVEGGHFVAGFLCLDASLYQSDSHTSVPRGCAHMSKCL